MKLAWSDATKTTAHAIARPERSSRADLRELDCDGAADALARAGHDRDAIAQRVG